jgi:hypothetical protein
MDLLNMIAQLDEAVLVLERLTASTGKRRGRPPAWMASAVRSSEKEKSGRVFSAETRKKMADAQKKRWAAFRKVKSKTAS